MMRVKLVIMIRIAGASDSTVSNTMICIAEERFFLSVRSGSWIGSEGESLTTLSPVTDTGA